MKTITIPETKFTWRTYKDPSYDERFPWVLEINGEIYNSYSYPVPDALATGLIKGRYIPAIIEAAIKEAK